MSGAPTLIQWMILLICLTTLLTTTQGRLSYLEHRDSLLCIYENDECRDVLHRIPQGKKQCEEALDHFLRIENEHQTDCQGARDPDCRIIDEGSTCTFLCDPTTVEIEAAWQDRRIATVNTKSLRAVTVTLRNFLQETEEDKRQRYERLGLRLQLREEMAQERNAREWQKRQERRQQFMEQIQVLQQGQSSEQRQQQLEQRQQQLEQRQQQSEQRKRQRQEERRQKFMEDRQRLFPSRVQGQQPEHDQPQPQQHQQQSQQELQQHQWRQLPQHQEQLHQPQPPQWQQQGQQQQLQLGGNAEARLRRRRRMDIVRGKRIQHP